MKLKFTAVLDVVDDNGLKTSTNVIGSMRELAEALGYFLEAKNYDGAWTRLTLAALPVIVREVLKPELEIIP